MTWIIVMLLAAGVGIVIGTYLLDRRGHRRRAPTLQPPRSYGLSPSDVAQAERLRTDPAPGAIPDAAIAERLLDRLRVGRRLTALELNVMTVCVNALITGGRYRRALAVELREQPPDTEWALLQVNLAEAEYNLGRWRAALERVEDMRARHAPSGLVAAGEARQRAWILTRLERLDEAARALARVTLLDLPPTYHAEYHFTRAALALASPDPAAALTHVDAGLALAVRPSSVRNGAFLRARIHAAAGRLDEALAEFARAAAMPYQGQGGDGLLAWGDLLADHTRTDGARAAWQLAIARDPESESAEVARARLARPRR